MSPFTLVLSRLSRKGEIPVRDALAMCRDTLSGDAVVMGLLSKGYATERDGVLSITEQGRRAAGEQAINRGNCHV